MKKKSEGKLKGKHVLVVEDYPHLGALLVRFLKKYVQTSYAHSRKQTLREITDKPPDIVLLDITLPDMSGLEVARKLGANRKTESIPILAMSGFQIEKQSG